MQLHIGLPSGAVTHRSPLRCSYTFFPSQVHPRFKFTPQADRYDVAVIRLDVPVLYQPHIQPICLPEKGTDYLGLYGWAAGWGAMQAGETTVWLGGGLCTLVSSLFAGG